MVVFDAPGLRGYAAEVRRVRGLTGVRTPDEFGLHVHAEPHGRRHCRYDIVLKGVQDVYASRTSLWRAYAACLEKMADYLENER